MAKAHTTFLLCTTLMLCSRNIFQTKLLAKTSRQDRARMYWLATPRAQDGENLGLASQGMQKTL
jgi:hypothetical protein